MQTKTVITPCNSFLGKMPIIGITVACVTYIAGYDTMILFIIITLIDLNEDNDVHVQQQQPLRK